MRQPIGEYRPDVMLGMVIVALGGVAGVCLLVTLCKWIFSN
jgi:hypothetical protein